MVLGAPKILQVFLVNIQEVHFWLADAHCCRKHASIKKPNWTSADVTPIRLKASMCSTEWVKSSQAYFNTVNRAVGQNGAVTQMEGMVR